MGRPCIDITGYRFGRLTVIRRVGSNKYSKPQWEARCTCGAFIITTGNRLRGGRKLSCGCLPRELSSERAIRITPRLSHGHAGTSGRSLTDNSL